MNLVYEAGPVELIDVTSTSSSTGNTSSDRMYKQYKPGHSADLKEKRKRRVVELEGRFHLRCFHWCGYGVD